MEALPEELLDMVSSKLDRPTLYSWVRSSRQFYRIGLANMYEVIWPSQMHLGQLMQLAMTFHQNPELAQLVKVLMITAVGDVGPVEDIVLPEIAAVYNEQITRDILASVITTDLADTVFAIDWMSALRNLDRDAWVAVMLPQMQNLRVLSLDYTNDPEFIQRVFIMAGERAGPFEERFAPFPLLHTVHLSLTGGWDNWGVKLSLGMPFFKLPAVRTIDAKNITDWENDSSLQWYYMYPNAHHTSNVRNIKVDKVIGCNGLHHWVNACKGLRSFEFGNWVDRCMASHLFHPRHLYHMIRGDYFSQSTLETLTVMFNSEDSQEPLNLKNLDQWMHSFSGFARLKNLHIRVPNLLKLPDQKDLAKMSDFVLKVPLNNCLPKSIECLTFTDAYPSHTPFLISELSGVIKRKDDFPCLKNLHLSLLIYEDPENPDHEEEKKTELKWFEDLCHNAGVGIVINTIFLRVLSEESDDDDYLQEMIAEAKKDVTDIDTDTDDDSAI